jgi:hypothetical protein
VDFDFFKARLLWKNHLGDEKCLAIQKSSPKHNQSDNLDLKLGKKLSFFQKA